METIKVKSWAKVPIAKRLEIKEELEKIRNDPYIREWKQCMEGWGVPQATISKWTNMQRGKKGRESSLGEIIMKEMLEKIFHKEIGPAEFWQIKPKNLIKKLKIDKYFNFICKNQSSRYYYIRTTRQKMIEEGVKRALESIEKLKKLCEYYQK
ncbi:hypothetical protein TTHERM_00458160 (macronuclear) [Tetrahymena thermophila SB210]|uniref:Uncharacterized protein n=1 Tax=Tetrahymena thermophila (strain SB210) TaxID=312017 RepID=I7LX90_TETTS|nr:hypothetical protein TTHERM_00458160 [Tetrahymena thermophila SB210]EAS03978.2 hypothetical protein TTHERM_00458160 [Tetrahymena thermophila SB210]|eukprot:XP_001024223.2 hypothetical protein TTHERM_00458160 [Tetrahymena thermophila SB210]